MKVSNYSIKAYTNQVKPTPTIDAVAPINNILPVLIFILSPVV
jgi:hypothetical protein